VPADGTCAATGRERRLRYVPDLRAALGQATACLCNHMGVLDVKHNSDQVIKRRAASCRPVGLRTVVQVVPPPYYLHARCPFMAGRAGLKWKPRTMRFSSTQSYALSVTGRSRKAGRCEASPSSGRDCEGCGGRCGMRAIEAEAAGRCALRWPSGRPRRCVPCDFSWRCSCRFSCLFSWRVSRRVSWRGADAACRTAAAGAPGTSIHGIGWPMSFSMAATQLPLAEPSVFSGLAALSGCPAGLITQLTSDWQNFI